MGANIPAGETIFHLDWDDFPQLFFFNPQFHYLLGLDPTFMYLTSPTRWRLWSDVATLLIGLLLEITVFLSTTFVVDRPRPHVVRLNSTPSTSSFPSGHTAAATVLFAGLALILGRHVEHRVVRAGVWALAVLVVALVAFSRVYRGLHHPTDVIAGVLYGAGCLVAGSQATERSAARVTGRDATVLSPDEGVSR